MFVWRCEQDPCTFFWVIIRENFFRQVQEYVYEYRLVFECTS